MSWFLRSLGPLQLLFVTAWVFEMGVSLGLAAPAGRRVGAGGSNASPAPAVLQWHRTTGGCLLWVGFPKGRQ